MPTVKNAEPAYSKEIWDGVGPGKPRHWAVQVFGTAAILLLAVPFALLVVLVTIMQHLMLWKSGD